MAPRTVTKRTQRGLTGIVARERLFAVLDGWRERPLTWIAGPPGAGKTVLAATYLDARSLPSVWCQLDAVDADPAVFFQHLGERLPARGRALPIFSDEYRRDLAGFCRRFWPQLFVRMRKGATLVVDGLPLPVEADFLGVILREAVQQLPDGIRMIVISRDEPPSELSRLRVQQDVGVLAWEELRFDLADARSVAAGVPGLADSELQVLHGQAAGWAAGLRMLLEHYRRTGRLRPGASPSGREALFGFLAAEVFDRLPPSTRGALLNTSLLPRVTRQGIEVLTGDAAAWPALAELNERHLFVDAVDGPEPTFQYHALFKDFLIARARSQLGAAKHRSLQQRTAAFLAARGEVAHAIPLYATAGDWVAAARLILVEATALLARGHSQTLRGWVQALPSWYVEATPRLLYCLGLTQSVLAPALARATLERAYQRFVAERHGLGQALTAAATIQTFYFEFDAVDGLDPWIDTLHALLQGGLSFPTAEIELHVCSMLQIAMTYRQPNHPFLGSCAERVLALISRGLDVNQTVAAAGLLLTHYDWFAPEKARLVVGFVQPLLRAKELTPFNRLWWLLSEASHHYIEGDRVRTSAIFSEIRSIASARGTLPNHALLCMLDVMEADEKAPGLAQFETMVHGFNPARRQEEQNFLNAAIALALRRRDRDRALEYAERALRLARDTGQRACELEAHAWLATVLNECGYAESALESVRKAREIVRGVEAPKIEFHHLLIEASAHLKLGRRADAHESLREGFALARAHGYSNAFQWIPDVLAKLCAEALNYDIEPQYVRRLIQIHGLLPSSVDACEAWPWRVRIRVLGQVAVRVEDTPLVFATKVQKKPLELLKALVAKGARDTSQAVLAQELWPDSEGDVAESALRMALHRLRKLLGADDSVVVQEGKLRLNDKICWVDAWTFEALCGTLDTMSEQVRAEQGERLLALYAGAAFEGETVQPWMLPARERWRGRFLHAVSLIGAAREAVGAWDPALEVYRRGLEADPLSEELYCRVMSCYLKQGRASEAYSAYRRCRDMLSLTLGVRPSPRTEALRQRAAELGVSH